MKFRNKIAVDGFEKKKVKYKFILLNSYLSDDGELILIENGCFTVDRAELIQIYFLKGLS